MDIYVHVYIYICMFCDMYAISWCVYTDYSIPNMKEICYNKNKFSKYNIWILYVCFSVTPPPPPPDTLALCNIYAF